MIPFVAESTLVKRWRQVLMSRPWKSLSEIKSDTPQDLSAVKGSTIVKCSSAEHSLKISLPLPSKILNSHYRAGQEIMTKRQQTKHTQGLESGRTLSITSPRACGGSSGIVDVAEIFAFAESQNLTFEKELQRQYLSEYRFKTGLAIQQALNRRALIRRGGCERACA